MMTIAQNNQLERYRNLLLSKGFKITADRRAIRPDVEITSNGREWICNDLIKKTTKKNDDLGRMLRAGV
ncbi:hypothetical protein O3W44_22700 [Pantoea sp. LMR881]|uniref:hypothetical protein n=1 Tax=Pantoea sp. LMR881 TaxID=3014336 RepID=UPI0022B06840|nr:hypothetical protein [Pantoea sp. LMR881]MCZ4061228.1 hypothetical protein [Pantoea sp. LMR881]MCZ4061344.1 hypothetical protein [Pantoea sp. LMR881]